MACNTSLTEITRGCDNNIGGLKGVYLIPAEFVTGTTLSAGTVVSIGLSGSASFIEYQFNKNSASFTEEAPINFENGSTYHVTNTTLKIGRREVAKRQSLSLLLAGQRDVYVILWDSNDKYWYQGYYNKANCSALGGGSGAAKGDGSNYELTITSEEPEQMPEVWSSIISSIIS